MRKKLPCLLSFVATVAAAAFYHPVTALATMPEPYKSTLLAKGRFGEIDVLNDVSHRMAAKESE